MHLRVVLGYYHKINGSDICRMRVGRAYTMNQCEAWQAEISGTSSNFYDEIQFRHALHALWRVLESLMVIACGIFSRDIFSELFVS